MTRRLREEIRQSRPFPTVEEEVYVELQRTAQVVGRRIALALRPWGLSEPQFNVLRILRGSHPEGLSSSAISERMVRYDPDLTRLMDLLEKRKLVEKRRDTADRRVVNSWITQEGLRIVEAASKDLRGKIVGSVRHMTRKQLEALADLLELAREGDAPPDPGTPVRAASSHRAGRSSARSRGAAPRRGP